MKKWLETDSFEEAFDKFNDNMEEIEQGFDNRYTKQEVDDELNTKADKLDTYTKQEVDNSLDLKADKQQEDWQEPVYLNGATGTVKYRKNELGYIELTGVLNTLTANPAFSIPVSYVNGGYQDFWLPTSANNTRNLQSNFRGHWHATSGPTTYYLYGLTYVKEK